MQVALLGAGGRTSLDGPVNAVVDEVRSWALILLPRTPISVDRAWLIVQASSSRKGARRSTSNMLRHHRPYRVKPTFVLKNVSQSAV